MNERTATALLVRHGHVPGIEPPRFRGRTELALTPLGRRQAEALRDRIAAEWQPVAVYSSPMGRCLATAETIAGPFGLAVAPVADLDDMDYGDWRGLTHDEVRRRWPAEYGLWENAPREVTPPGGENLDALAARALRGSRAILRRHRGETVVVAAHDSVNRVLLLHALGLALARYWDLVQAPCTLNVLRFDNGRVKVATLNETGHLVAVQAASGPDAGTT